MEGKECTTTKNSIKQINIWAKNIAKNLKGKRLKQSSHTYKARAHIGYTRAQGRYCKSIGNEI